MTETPKPLNLSEVLSDEDLKQLRKLMRALDGQSIEEGDLITKLTNPKNIIERSRFPTYPILSKNVYLRLVARLSPEEFHSFSKWANLEAEALISYKGEGRKEYVEMSKAPQPNDPNTQTVIGAYTGAQPQQPKKRFWQRSPKESRGEFENQ